MSTAGNDIFREFVGEGVVAKRTDEYLQRQNVAGVGRKVVAGFGAECHKAVHEERDDRDFGGSGVRTSFFYHKSC